MSTLDKDTVHGIWDKSITQTSRGKDYLFKTGGTYVDRNIHLSISAQSFTYSKSVSSMELNPQIIKGADGTYSVVVNQTHYVNPGMITNGWIQDPVLFTISGAGHCYIDAAGAPSVSLVEDFDYRSGYSRMAATGNAGYNAEDKGTPLNIFQGLVDIGAPLDPGSSYEEFIDYGSKYGNFHDFTYEDIKNLL